MLVDSSVWIDHLHRRDEHLTALLERGEVCGHPCVVGELALGSLKDRADFLSWLQGLPTLRGATDREVLMLVQSRKLFGRGLRLVDAHLLAATLLSAGSSLWTRDRRLGQAAEELGIATGLP